MVIRYSHWYRRLIAHNILKSWRFPALIILMCLRHKCIKKYCLNIALIARFIVYIFYTSTFVRKTKLISFHHYFLQFSFSNVLLYRVPSQSIFLHNRNVEISWIYRNYNQHHWHRSFFWFSSSSYVIVCGVLVAFVIFRQLHILFLHLLLNSVIWITFMTSSLVPFRSSYIIFSVWLLCFFLVIGSNWVFFLFHSTSFIHVLLITLLTYI